MGRQTDMLHSTVRSSLHVGGPPRVTISPIHSRSILGPSPLINSPTPPLVPLVGKHKVPSTIPATETLAVAGAAVPDRDVDGFGVAARARVAVVERAADLAKFRVVEELGHFASGVRDAGDAAVVAGVLLQLHAVLDGGRVVGFACEIVARGRGDEVLRVAGGVQGLLGWDQGGRFGDAVGVHGGSVGVLSGSEW